MNQKHSPVKPHAMVGLNVLFATSAYISAGHQKLKVVAQESSAAQSMVSELEQCIIALQNEVMLRDVAWLKAQDDLKNKHQELDKTVAETLDWVPRAIIDAQRKHDYTYRLLCQTSTQLMSYQRQLKIPISPSFVEEMKEYSPKKAVKVQAEAGDVSALLREELVDSKVKIHLVPELYSLMLSIQRAYEQEVARLNERVAYLEARLADADQGERAQLKTGSISVLGSMSLRSPAMIEKAYPHLKRGESSDVRPATPVDDVCGDEWLYWCHAD
ncbi:hypothetical protein DFH05DRAFT_1457149 [Lentinula detonsa]|uniref:Uncharacterized protein n=1 Tax=Lentinula detonsa TaxID=2804962 RepID=A0A9W8U243_9AGAR|nr:hypothetical protein DFH05DRAFT_1457149 [Lentinula detonsa]